MLLAFLLYYRDWLPIVFAAGIIAVHHLAFNYLQVSTDIPVYVFTANTGLEIVLLHAAYVVFESAILVVMSIKLRREARETEDVYAVVGSLLEGGDQIDLRGSGHMPGSLIGRALHNVMTQTRKVMQDTGNVTRELDETSTQMSTLAENLAKNFRAEEANTEQATSAVSEATTAVQQVATCAREAAEAAANVDTASRECSREINNSRQVVEHLSRSVHQAGERVSLLNEDSQRIGSVLDVISSVAEQTNLLALNAAIEAARAGEHGRGFAVVADEVRELAGKTQQSAQEIQNVIDNVRREAMEANDAMAESRKASEDTVTVFDALTERLHTIASGIERINVANTQTAEAAVHQQQLMENGNNGMLAIRDDILASSDEVSHLARVSGNLRGLAEQLMHHSARFSV
ncbi:methyl-accepting chemotaxis protein [Marinobacter salinexigens]|uniref:Methyl-accepting chemotaxis protein n=2 Tax=Marinobacter salinexigens TaxID=2919747 RepID=A0A5B0VRM8_9GAMM|nr:methyl-accepting chemotaxis protein [Marinobacter salinexigens]